ncbi:MAG: aldose epimerase family protein, partial [Nocardioides sp.]
VVRGSGLRTMALLDSPHTRTRLEIRSDQPGLQIFTGQAFDGSSRSIDGVPLASRAGLALEPQLFPDTPHHPEWPSAELRPGETYAHVLEWRFSHVPVS